MERQNMQTFPIVRVLATLNHWFKVGLYVGQSGTIRTRKPYRNSHLPEGSNLFCSILFLKISESDTITGGSSRFCTAWRGSVAASPWARWRTVAGPSEESATATPARR